MKRIGTPVAEEKTLGPTQVLEYLRLVLNFLLQVIEIPKKKRLKCLSIINKLWSAFINRKKVMVKDIQHAVGNLNFICQVLPAGRVFLCSLYRLTRGAQGQKVKAGHHRWLCRETFNDLMFAKFLDERATQHMKSIPFLNRLQVLNSDLQLFANSAGSENLNFSCFFQGDWRQGFWWDTELLKNNNRPNIALLELYAIVVAMAVWAEKVATTLDKKPNGEVSKARSLIGKDCSAEVTAARQDMARVKEGDPS